MRTFAIAVSADTFRVYPRQIPLTIGLKNSCSERHNKSAFDPRRDRHYSLQKVQYHVRKLMHIECLSPYTGDVMCGILFFTVRGPVLCTV